MTCDTSGSLAPSPAGEGIIVKIQQLNIRTLELDYLI